MANEYLKRTPTSTGNRLKATWSFWVKRNKLEGTSASTYLFYATSGSGADAARYNDDDGGDSLRTLFWNGTNNGGFINYDKLRDTSSWQHYLIVYDSTLNTKDNMSNNDQTLERIKIFVNGRRMIETGGSSAQNTGVSANQLLTKWGNAGIVNALFATNTGTNTSALQTMDTFFVDGQALTPDVFGFYKDGNGYISAGSTQSTDFRPGQWVPKTPRVIKAQIERNGGFGVNGYYLPMNDSSNFGADFHTTPNSIITLKGENLPQPRNGAPTTTDAYVSQLRTDPYAANLVLAIPFITGGQGSGAGDYSADIKGTGTNKTVTLNGTFSVGECASYYGSALKGSSGARWVEVSANSDFANLYDVDHTIEFWYKNDAWTSGYLPHNDIMGLNVSGTTNVAWRITFTDKNVNNQVEDGIELFGDTTFSTGPQILNNDWNHCAVVQEGNNTTIYINGVAQVIGGKHGYAANKASTGPIIIGADPRVNPQDGSTYLYNGQLQDIRVYKGVAKYKGGFDVPKPYTPVGIETWRAVSDTTANNFATLNALYRGEYNNRTLTNGNLTVSHSSDDAMVANVGVTTGKWYWETLPSAISGNNNYYGIVGAGANSLRDLSYYYRSGSGTIVRRIDNVTTNLQSSLTNASANDVIGIAFNASDKELSWYLNGSQLGTTVTSVASATNGNSEYFPLVANENSAGGKVNNLNFGQNPTFSGNTTAGTFTDSNGKGLFKYEPPSGFLALCEDNLPTPAIKNPGEHFKTVLYHGDSNDGRSITGVGFKPDLVWIKERTSSSGHYILDSLRGATNYIRPNETNAEASSDNTIKSFDFDGFTLGDSGAFNVDDDYVAWCWRAGAGTTSINTDGSIDSVVSVNQDAGFSIIKVDSLPALTTSTFGHGLNKKPDFIIFKSRNNSTNWDVYHSSLTPDGERKLYLNGTNAEIDSGFMGDTPPTSSVISFNPGSSISNHIVYCWAEIENFSKFGSYIGNGNADGPFVFTNGRPAFVMIKRTDTTGSWVILDSSRKSVNPNDKRLYPNLSNIEETGVDIIDFLSNGFKIRESGNLTNASGGTYIFAAFAESPFTTANAK